MVEEEGYTLDICGYNITVIKEDVAIPKDSIVRMLTLPKLSGRMVDIGAHVGSVSICAISKGIRQVIAFEPNQRNFALLCNNIVKNNLWGKIIPLPLAVTMDKPFTTKKLMSWFDNGGMNSTLYPEGKLRIRRENQIEEMELENCQVATIPFIEVLRLCAPIEYLKIDIEGGEWDLFSNMNDSRFMEGFSKVHYFELEVHSMLRPEFGRTEKHFMEDKLMPALEGLGFQVKPILSGHWRLPGVLCENKRWRKRNGAK